MRSYEALKRNKFVLASFRCLLTRRSVATWQWKDFRFETCWALLRCAVCLILLGAAQVQPKCTPNCVSCVLQP